MRFTDGELSAAQKKELSGLPLEQKLEVFRALMIPPYVLFDRLVLSLDGAVERARLINPDGNQIIDHWEQELADLKKIRARYDRPAPVVPAPAEERRRRGPKPKKK